MMEINVIAAAIEQWTANASRPRVVTEICEFLKSRYSIEYNALTERGWTHEFLPIWQASGKKLFITVGKLELPTFLVNALTGVHWTLSEDFGESCLFVFRRSVLANPILFVDFPAWDDNLQYTDFGRIVLSNMCAMVSGRESLTPEEIYNHYKWQNGYISEEEKRWRSIQPLYAAVWKFDRGSAFRRVTLDALSVIMSHV